MIDDLKAEVCMLTEDSNVNYARVKESTLDRHHTSRRLLDAMCTQVHSSGCGQLSTDHLGFMRIVLCRFCNKRMH